ncbi:SusD/RagB family nutrient-binding outer membrane lipoprotein [Pedobacter sp. V48]|uniref:SusD/RagB family nutrient-binding outer membrane lipoprotein n=1 Tax=Pedobacter sp. V48 TaxID=509635 RepID=UPI0003E543E6|nr:SusD/RagB family nutrient-binding outer membrane lipoprotein [Pedobacter sp. V48]ETZ19255.1 hypothetical protein N824_10975 [Pedobacter sp. V48]
MKKLKIIGLYMAALVSVVGCKSDLDINRDPYLPTEATPKLLLPSGIAYSASKIGGDLQNLGAFWSQHYTQNNTSAQYKTVDQYSIGVADYNTVWTSVFGGGLKDLSLTMEMSKASGAWNYYIPASVMSVLDFHVLVDFYSQLPYTEGLTGDKNKAPHWEDGKVVNAKLIAQLDEAISKGADAIALPKIGNEDFIFQGDIAQWIKFAKTLKLKILMRDFTANQAAIQALLTEGDLLATLDAKMTGFSDVESKSNPLYEYDRRKLNTFSNIKASNTLLSFLKKNNDPRIGNFFELADVKGQPGQTAYIGIEQGNFTLTGPQTNETSRAVLAATDPVYFASAAESKFLQAEAWARLGDAGKAKTAYDQGVTLAFARWSKDASSFIATGGAYEFKAGTTEQMVKAIITQKWVAAVRCQAWDSFFDQNRTGYPVVSPVGTDAPGYVAGEYTISVNTSLGGTEIPRRLLYPKISSDFNPNTPKAVAINTKMWWHKQ